MDLTKLRLHSLQEPELKMKILPAPHRCGICGNGEICAESLYRHGYCIDPKVRMAYLGGT